MEDHNSVYEYDLTFWLQTTFCVSFAVLGLLPSFAATLYYGMGYAGTAGMVWGWLIAMIFIQCVAMSESSRRAPPWHINKLIVFHS